MAQPLKPPRIKIDINTGRIKPPSPVVEEKEPKGHFPMLVFAGVVLSILALTLSALLIFNKQPETSTYLEVVAHETLIFEDRELRLPNQYFEKLQEPIAKSVIAESVLSYNPKTYQTYVERGANKKRQIASITKLMTAIVVKENFDLDSEITIQKEYKELEWYVGFQKDDKIKVSELLKAMLVSSYNDAAMILAENFPNEGFEGFIGKMNEIADLLGMEDSNFANPHGFDNKDNFSTANDIRKLVQLFITHQDLLEFTSSSSAELVYKEGSGLIKRKKIYTTNQFIGEYSTVKGLKTGYTTSAGACLVAYFDAGDGDELVTIVLGAGDRFADSRRLLEIVNESYD